jgi:restriction endonuclease S subunit
MTKEDWIECKIGDVYNFIGGGTPSKNHREFWNGNILWASIKDIKGKYLKTTIDTITQAGLENSASNIANYGDVILATRINPGRAIICKVTTSINQDLKVVKPQLTISNLFTYYLFRNLEKKIIRQSSGTTVLGLNLSILNDINIFFPPQPIQRAIVKKIEQLFSALDGGIADLKKAQEQLKVYRQAVLKKAFEGELTRISIKNNERIGSIVIVNPKIDKDELHDELECQFVPMKLVEEITNKIHLTETQPYKNLQGKSYTYFADKDVIFAKVTPCMENGKTAVAKNLKNKIAFGSSEFHVLRCTDKLVPDYLFYFLIQDRFRIEAEQNMTGAVGLRRVPKTFIEDYLIPLPPVDQQLKIIKEIESRLSVCDTLEQQINASLQQSEALRQSILKKAFAGELLTQMEIAACKQEPDYEPASALLKRIKAEKGNAPKVSADIHAGLIAKIIKLHETNPIYKDRLSHIKCEKIAHLVEYHAKIPLGRQPVKDAAGPDDYPHLKKVESRATKAGFFKIKKNNIGYTYLLGNQIDTVIQKFETSLSTDQSNKVNELLQLFLQFDLEQAEIAATTYAGWNNLIILGNSNPSDEEIVTESRENWSTRKLNIPRERFFNAINWLRKKEVNLIPTGYGLLVTSPTKKKK